MASKMPSTGPPRRSVLHNSNSTGPPRSCGSVNFAPDDDSRRSSTDDTPTAVAAADETPAYERLRRLVDSAATTIGWYRGRRVQAALAAAVAVVGYQMAISDVDLAVRGLCGVVVTLLGVAFCFCALAVYLRDAWSNTAVYVLFATCFGAELAFGRALDGVRSTSNDDGSTAGGPAAAAAALLVNPLSTLGILTAAAGACTMTTLDASGGILVVLLVSAARYVASTVLTDLPPGVRPLLAYVGGLGGVVAARYVETVFLTPGARYGATGAGGASTGAAGMATGSPYLRLPDVKSRRRSNSTAPNSYNAQCAARRISLPTLVHRPLGTTVILDGTLVREAEGLLADMMADPEVPRHLLNGLRAVSNLLKATDASLVSGPTGGVHRAKTSPVVSLSECSLSTSAEYADLPFADRPIYLPKRLRRSLPSTLTRCRSAAATWTTTTSATGMPSLESEPPPRRVKLSLGRTESGGSAPGGGKLGKRLLTSDYESGESPSSSDVGGERAAGQLGVADQSSSSGLLQLVDERPTSPLTFHLDLDQSDDREDTESTPGDVVTSLPVAGHSDSSTQTNFGRKNSTRSSHITFADEVYVLGPSSSSSSLTDARRRRSSTPSVDEVGPLTSSSDVPAGPASVDLSFVDDEIQSGELMQIGLLSRWDYPVFELADRCPDTLLSRMAYKLFTELGFVSTFNIPAVEFLTYFHALELGYRDKPYHNRLHATDVLHAVWYMTTQPVPGFVQVAPDENSISDTGASWQNTGISRLTAATNGNGTYGIVGANFPPLELMALYAAAAMHDFDHPGRTNAFLVTSGSPLAVLYNDRSVLENHHAAAAWRLLLSDPCYSWLVNLDYSEFKRFRYLVIEAILATDLKRHFDLLAEFNAKVNDAEAPGIDWTLEADRLMVSNMIIKMADINGPCKPKDLHLRWTDRITEEFYEQGDEEASLGLTISPYMNRRQPQLAKLQESFINHLVAPLCNALSTAGLLPGVVLDDSEESDASSGVDDEDAEVKNEDSSSSKGQSCSKSLVSCSMVKNLEDNHEMWVKVIDAEARAADNDSNTERMPTANCRLSSAEVHSDGQAEMEPISEEDASATTNGTNLTALTVNNR